jgi:hypothetical protein
VRHSCVDAVLGAAGYWDDTGTVSLASSRSHDGGVEFRVLFANQVGENSGRSLPSHQTGNRETRVTHAKQAITGQRCALARSRHALSAPAPGTTPTS